MDISILPEEVFEEIALYLNIDDVLSCCLVSPRWRNAINKNNIWFKLCAKKYTKVTRNNVDLLDIPCLVQPAFTLPEQSCETLTSICPWRKRYMQEAHIGRNWRHQRCIAQSITTAINPQFIECDDDVIVISCMEQRAFTTWSINTFPKRTQNAPYSLWHVLSDFFKLSNGKLVIVQCTLLQVYIKSPQHTFELTSRFLFNKTEEESSNIPITNDISDWYNNNIGLYPSDLNTDCDHNGSYFVGLVHQANLNEAVFHIWDIHSGHKANEERMPDVFDVVTDVHFSLNSSNLHILLKLKDEFKEYTSIYCYNLDTFKYTNFLLRFDYVVPIVLFGDTFLLNSDYSQKSLWLWKTEDASFVHKITCDMNIQPTSLQFIHSYVIFAGNSQCLGFVKVFDTNTLEMTCEFVSDFRVTTVSFIRSDLLLVSGSMQLGLWDISSGTKLYNLDFQDCLWTNCNDTKIIVENHEELQLLQFW